MPVSSVISASAVAKSYGRRQVLRDVSFDVAPATLVGIVGENGAGKSTLLRILAGDLRPSAGRVILHGRLGYCPQAVVLNDTLTVHQHLDYFRAAYSLPDTGAASDLIERLAFDRYRDAPAGALSGGTRQKLNLTLALMHSPDVLLLDEPYQGFDWETYLRFWDLAAELRSRGAAVLVISHLLFDQQRFDAIYQLREGQLQAPVENPLANKDFLAAFPSYGPMQVAVSGGFGRGVPGGGVLLALMWFVAFTLLGLAVFWWRTRAPNLRREPLSRPAGALAGSGSAR